MYTCCPECRTWFRVTESQLGAAQGWVRCGQCFESFDASPRLWSEPDEGSAAVPWKTAPDPDDSIALTEPEPHAASGSSREEVHEESFEPRPGPLPEDPREEDLIIDPLSFEEVEIEVELDSDPAGPMVGDVRRVSSGESHERAGGADRIHEGRVAARRRRSREQAILNRIEGLDVRRGRRWAANSCIVLLLMLVLQYAWFMAGDLAAAFPILGPSLEEFCSVTGCETNRRSREEGVRVVSRTVRPHPEYTSALSVRATLENRSLEARPFPVVVFVLYGKDGRAVASRAFEPAEYLDEDTVPADGLESGRRAEIAFDLVAPSEVAVSFDLRLI